MRSRLVLLAVFVFLLAAPMVGAVDVIGGSETVFKNLDSGGSIIFDRNVTCSLVQTPYNVTVPSVASTVPFVKFESLVFGENTWDVIGFGCDSGVMELNGLELKNITYTVTHTTPTATASFYLPSHSAPARVVIDGIIYKAPELTKSAIDGADYNTWYYEDHMVNVKSTGSVISLLWTQTPTPGGGPGGTGDTGDTGGEQPGGEEPQGETHLGPFGISYLWWGVIVLVFAVVVYFVFVRP